MGISKQIAVVFLLGLAELGHALPCPGSPEAEIIHDNLKPFAPAGRASTTKYCQARPPSLRTLFFEGYEDIYVRREELPAIDMANGQQSKIYLSVRGTSRREVNETRFENISGRSGGGDQFENIPDRKGSTTLNFPFAIQPQWQLSQGLNLANSSAMGEIAATIYQSFPEAATKYAAMGFKEQYFFASTDRGTEGAVLKKDDIIVIAYRGTEPKSLRDWLTDANFLSISIDGKRGGGRTMPRIHRGFYKASMEVMPFVLEHIPSTLENRLRWAVNDIAQERDPRGRARLIESGFAVDAENPQAKLVRDPDLRPIAFAGHSLGGALSFATMAHLLLAHRDPLELGYYFADPVLADISNRKNSNIDLLIQNLMGPLGLNFIFTTVERNAMNPAVVELNEPEDFDYITLSWLPTIKFDADGGGGDLNFRETYLKDRRLRMATTFGAPRTVDWLGKFMIERHAIEAGTVITRFENLHRINNPDSLTGDLVTRIPIHALESAALEWVNSLIDHYTHIGTRVFFNSPRDDVDGDLSLLHCKYTNSGEEAGLSLGRLLHIGLAVARHDMSLYLARIRSYLPSGAARLTGVVPLPEECRSLSYAPMDFGHRL